MNRVITTIAITILLSLVASLPVRILTAQDGDTSQSSPYSSLQEIPSDVPANPYNNYPFFNNPYPDYNNYPGYSGGYYNGYSNYNNRPQNYYNSYQNRYYQNRQRPSNYSNPQYRNNGPYSGQRRDGAYGGERGERGDRGGR